MVWSRLRFVNSWKKRGHDHIVILSFESPEILSLLIDNVQDVPDAVRQQILSSIRSFLDKQVE